MLSRADLRHTLRSHGLRLQRRLGQNLLVDRRVRDRIIDALGLTDRTLCIEIGAGLGALTEMLAERCAGVLAVEIDAGFVRWLADEFGSTASVEVLHADFLDLDLPDAAMRLYGQHPRGRELIIVGNIPYSTTSPLLFKVLESSLSYRAFFCTVQREVADRLTSAPGSKDYGPLSIAVAYRAKVERLFRIGRKAFFPEPEVESAFLTIRPRARPPVRVADEDLLFALVRSAFSRRRKMLKNALMTLEYGSVTATQVARALETCRIEGTVRAEQLTMHDFARVANTLSAMIETTSEGDDDGAGRR